MSPGKIFLAGAIALVLSACGQSPAPSGQPAPSPAAAPVPAVAPAPAAEKLPAPTEPAPTGAAPAATGNPAVVADCATSIESNDAMRYDADSITVPASCAQFTIHLKHVGSMPVAAMGHNVVVARDADMNGIAIDGMTVAPEHLKADDARVIAHTRMIGGGESASVTFDVAKVRDGGPYKFFCSFPGHLALMQGDLQVR